MFTYIWGIFKRCEFWTLFFFWNRSFWWFVFVVISWLEPCTAFLKPKRAFSFLKVVLCSTTGGQHVQTFGIHCRTWLSDLNPWQWSRWNLAISKVKCVGAWNFSNDLRSLCPDPENRTLVAFIQFLCAVVTPQAFLFALASRAYHKG